MLILVHFTIMCISSVIWKSFMSSAERWQLWEEFGCSVRNRRELGFCGLYCSPVNSVITTIFYFNPAGRFLDIFVLMLYCFCSTVRYISLISPLSEGARHL